MCNPYFICWMGKWMSFCDPELLLTFKNFKLKIWFLNQNIFTGIVKEMSEAFGREQKIKIEHSK